MVKAAKEGQGGRDGDAAVCLWLLVKLSSDPYSLILTIHQPPRLETTHTTVSDQLRNSQPRRRRVHYSPDLETIRICSWVKGHQEDRGKRRRNVPSARLPQQPPQRLSGTPEPNRRIPCSREDNSSASFPRLLSIRSLVARRRVLPGTQRQRERSRRRLGPRVEARKQRWSRRCRASSRGAGKTRGFLLHARGILEDVTESTG